MATDFKLPFLGENIATATVVRLMVAEGDTVKAEQAVLEVETDKAALEVPCPLAGRVARIHVKEGQKVSVGAVVLTIEESGAAAQPAGSVAVSEPKPAVAAAPPPAPAVPVAPAVPARRPSETETVVMKRPSEQSTVAAPRPEPSVSTVPEEGYSSSGDVLSSPATRRLAREIGVDIAQVKGTGPEGRITKDDVKEAARRMNKDEPSAPAAVEPAAPVAPAASVPVRADVPLPNFESFGAVEREAMSQVRRLTAERMASAWATIPHVTQFDKADITELEEIRKRFAASVEKSGGKLTVTAILVKVVASALKVFPKFNASIDLARNEIVYKKFINIGVAVDTERGLLVPVIRDADRRNIHEIAAELARIAEKARTKKITPDELQGGTFTLTNLGGIGGTYFTPIVNAPEVAILGISRSLKEPCHREVACAPRLMLPLSLSYDHRLIDGADGARFLRWICEALEQPFLLSLEG